MMKYGTMSYLFHDGKILMVKKVERIDDPNSGCYTLLGGKLLDSEKGNLLGRMKSAIRETKEETGLTLLAPKLRGVILFDNSERIFDNWPNPEDFLVYLFFSKNYTGELKSRTNEGIPLWIDESSLNNVKKNIGDEKMYEWLKNSRYFVGVIKYQGRVLDEIGTFVNYF